MRLNAVQTRTWSPFRFLVSATRTLGCDHVRVPLWSVTGTGHDDVSSIQRSTMTGKTHPATASKVISPSLGPQKAEERDLRTLAEQFGTGVYPVDFTKEAAAKAVDAWVKQQTAGRITKL